jgi:hypothetical protein
VPLIALLLSFALQRGLAPLMTATVRRTQGAASLDPIPDAALPEEIRPLVGSINALLHRLSLVFFSHAGSSPMPPTNCAPRSALKLQLRIVEARNRSPHVRSLAGSQTSPCCARATPRRAVARSVTTGTRRRRHRTRPTDLASLARSVVGELSVQAEAKDVDLGAEADASTVIEGDDTQLRLLINNLVDNAIYSPRAAVSTSKFMRIRNTHVEVSDTDLVYLSRSDRVFDRFINASNVQRMTAPSRHRVNRDREAVANGIAPP